MQLTVSIHDISTGIKVILNFNMWNHDYGLKSRLWVNGGHTHYGLTSALSISLSTCPCAYSRACVEGLSGFPVRPHYNKHCYSDGRKPSL